MIIGVDLRCLPSDGSPGAGIAHAAKALTKKLISLNSAGIEWLIFLPVGADPGAEVKMILPETAFKARIVRIENTGGASLRRALKKFPCDLLFVPSGAIPPGISEPVVPWVHDIAIFDHPDWFPEPLLQRTISTGLFKRGVKRAKNVLTVSDFTKNEVINKFNVNPEIITVTYEGGSDTLAGLSDEELDLEKQSAKARVVKRGITNPYILCMGTLEPRKNIPFLVTAWLKARLLFNKPTDLVIAGRDGWKLGSIMKSMSVDLDPFLVDKSKLHRIETPSNNYRRDLLLVADIVATPSLYEGFGLVALEGMQAESAVLSSSAAALPEVVGDAAILLSPNDEDAWVRTMISVMNDPIYRSELAKQGKARSQSMTWDRTARIVMNVLTKSKSQSILRKQQAAENHGLGRNLLAE
ncbi:MAG: glycosyltransferase family 1 protein [Patescibacteria group bacterium]